MSLPKDWKQIPITEILSPEEIKATEKIFRTKPDKDQIKALKDYLIPLKEKLEAKGLLPEFLAYALYAKAHKIIP